MGKRIRITNETLNCYRTWIKTAGVDVGQFRRNPVMLWMHQRGEIIGCLKDILVEGEEITAEPYFDEVTETSRRAKAQWEKGTLRMGSPHFEVTETSDAPELMKEGQMAPTITRCKLIEYSMVDIGGNDDNIRLAYAGENIDKDNAGNVLALANNNSFLPNNKLEKMEKPEMQAIALMLGLKSECSLDEMQKEVKALLLAKEECETLRKDVAALNKEIAGMKRAGVEAMVDEAVAHGKIDADKRAHFVELGEKLGTESLKLTLDAMRAPVKPSAVLGRETRRDAKKWCDASSEELMLMREENPEEYKRLYREEFGVECKI